MIIAILNAPGKIKLENRPIPTVEDNDLLLEVIYCGICGTDLKLYRGQGPFELSGPTVLGHEIAARVHTVGCNIKQFKKGDRVVVNPLKNAIGLGGIDGAFANYILISDAASSLDELHQIPDIIPNQLAPLVEPMAVALHGVNKLIFTGKARDLKVLISGAGPIGLCSLVVLRSKGITDIVVADPNPHRRIMANHMGASFTFDPFEEEMHTVLADIHGSRKPVFLNNSFPTTQLLIECSGQPQALRNCITAMGEYSQLLVLAATGKIDLDIATLQAKGGRIITSIVYKNEFAEAIQLIQQNASWLQAMISHIIPLEEIQSAFDLLCQPNTPAGKVLIQP